MEIKSIFMFKYFRCNLYQFIKSECKESEEFDLTWPWNVWKFAAWQSVLVETFPILTDIMHVRRETRYEKWHMPSCEIYYHWYKKNTDWVGKVVTEIHNSPISSSSLFYCVYMELDQKLLSLFYVKQNFASCYNFMWACSSP